MNTKLYSLILAISFSTYAFSGVIKENAKYFKTVGSQTQFSWAPEEYQNNFRYDVLYYIPKSLESSENVKSIIFLHGGGDETLSREGSLQIANFYMTNYVKKLADELNTIVIVPSGSGLNWGGHTSFMLRKLSTLIRQELDIDQNQLGLSGHSMGGMGITRSYSQLVDEFSYFVPLSAGMDITYQTENRLNKAFNVPYVHIQGRSDSYVVFMERCNLQLKNMQDLEAKYETKSMFEMIFYDGTHQPNHRLWVETVKRLQETAPRNIYQTTLFGNLMINSTFYTDNAIQFYQGSHDRYFWVKVLDAVRTGPEKIQFKAIIKDNRIDLNFETKPVLIKSIQVSISSKMVRLDKYKVYLNGEFIDRASHLAPKILPENDPSYIFEEALNISF